MRGVIAAALLVIAASPAAAQVNQGRALFGEQCAACHGADGRGLNGPNLTGLFRAGGNDDRVLQMIRNGVPGSIMPASRNSDEEIRSIVSYLKLLATPPPVSAANERANPNADLVKLTVVVEIRRPRRARARHQGAVRERVFRDRTTTRVGARRAHRPPVLDVSPRPAG
ncbi:MAG: cytochrome c [Cyanobacteria bacterium]|nr:cytochrome c [Cyanobacteriota bacterium]